MITAEVLIFSRFIKYKTYCFSISKHLGFFGKVTLSSPCLYYIILILLNIVAYIVCYYIIMLYNHKL